MILASDDPKKKKAKGLVSAAGGTIGGILGGVAAGTLGAIGGPMSIVMGGLGAVAGDYLGRMIVGTPAIQNMLAPWFEKLFLGDTESKEVTAYKASAPKKSKPKKAAPVKAAAKPITPPPPAKKKQAAKPKLPSAKSIAAGTAASLKPTKKSPLDAIDIDDGTGRNAQGGYDFVKDPVTGGMKQVQPKKRESDPAKLYLKDPKWRKIVDDAADAKHAWGMHIRANARLLASPDPTAMGAGFAAGGSVLQGGMALVGEKGPEMVSLPRGAYVTPNDAFAKSGAPAPQAQAQSAGGTNPVAVNVSINVDDRRLKEVFSTTVEQVITGA
jgi:hypothetical protein